MLLPLSSPRAWEPATFPEELRGERPLPGQPLRAAGKVEARLGSPIAVGFALLACNPDEPFAHAFNVRDGRAIDLALAEHEVIAYWGYVPSPSQLRVDRLCLAAEAPPPKAFRDLPRRPVSRAASCP